MAFLSGVTHNKLVGKYTPTHEGLGGPASRIDRDTIRERSGSPVRYSCGAPARVTHADVPDPLHGDPEAAGVRPEGHFTAGLRCAEPERGSSTGAGAGGEALVWAGETDGLLSVRGTGGRNRAALCRQKGVFVTCMRHHHRHMWVGFTDGHIRVFDLDGRRDQIAHSRKHRGAVTCMISVGSNVFSGGVDWQVLVWKLQWTRHPDPGAGAVAAVCLMDQYSGHLGAVRCLAHEAAVLFSGGDDRTIRCIDMRTGEEHVSAPARGFPITSHGGAISALVVYEHFLFSASHDGSIRVWEAGTGRAVRTLLRSEGPVLCLLKDPAAGRIWSGGVDGLIRVWDAAGSHALLCEIDDHAGSIVHSLVCTGRHSTTKAWVVDGQSQLRLWTADSESGHFAEELHEAEDREQELLHDVGVARALVVSSGGRLAQKKARLAMLQRLDCGRRDAAIACLRKAQHRSLGRLYLERLTLWHRRLEGTRRRQQAAELLLRSTDNGLRAIAYCRIRRYASERAVREHRRHLGDALLRTTKRGLTALAFGALRRYADLGAIRRRRRFLADALSSTTSRGLCAVAWQRWRRWLLGRTTQVKRGAVSAALLGSSDRALTMSYYARLVRHMRVEGELERRRLLCALMIRCLTSGLRKLYYQRLYAWRQTSAQRRQARSHATIFADLLTTELRRKYWARLELLWIERKALSIDYERQDLLQQVKEVEACLTSDDEARAQLEELEQRKMARDRELAVLRDKAAHVQGEHERLMVETMKSCVDPEASITEQFSTISTLLKAKGVNCQEDLGVINACHESFRAGRSVTGRRGSSIAEASWELLQKGVRRVRQAISPDSAPAGSSPRRRSSAAAPRWVKHGEDAREVVDRMDSRTLGAAHRGLKEIVIAIDQYRQLKARLPESVAREVVANYRALFAVAARKYGERMRAEEQELQDFAATTRSNPASPTSVVRLGRSFISTSSGSSPRHRAGSAARSRRSPSSGHRPAPRRSVSPYGPARDASSVGDGNALLSSQDISVGSPPAVSHSPPVAARRVGAGRGTLPPRRGWSETPESTPLAVPASPPSSCHPQGSSGRLASPARPAQGSGGARPASPARPQELRRPSPQRAGAAGPSPRPAAAGPAARQPLSRSPSAGAAAARQPLVRTPSGAQPLTRAPSSGAAGASGGRPLQRGDSAARAQPRAPSRPRAGSRTSATSAPAPLGTAVPGFRVTADLRVAQVTSSAAEEAGVAVGDKILAVRGRNMKDKPSYVQLLQHTVPGDTVSFRLQRAFGTTVTVSVVMQPAA